MEKEAQIPKKPRLREKSRSRSFSLVIIEDSEAVEFNEEEDIDRVQEERFHREKITGEDLILVVRHELVSAERRTTLRQGWGNCLAGG
jgi:hypothetical protein